MKKIHVNLFYKRSRISQKSAIMDYLHYVALLRGINVGGNNIIKMADLKACFESLDFKAVSTYIQSGNVLFSTIEPDQTKLESLIEKTLSGRFSYKSNVVLISHIELKKVVTDAPDKFGSNPDQFRYDVLFLKKPLTAGEAMNKITLREGVDSAREGDGVIYFSRLISKAGQSYLNKIITLPVYKQMTIRNWNTTSKLFKLSGSQQNDGLSL
jgi:uncharacterized protein (DUF1697 family)